MEIKKRKKKEKKWKIKEKVIRKNSHLQRLWIMVNTLVYTCRIFSLTRGATAVNNVVAKLVLRSARP